MNELEIVEKIRKLRGAKGIGDDCFIFPHGSEDLLFTVDQLIEDVHFRRSLGAVAIGERAMARSLSDIAAMGGEPRFCLVSLAVPGDTRWIEGFYRGLLRFKVPLAGGDLARAKKIHCDVMVCGAVARGKALRRDGAKPGDAIYISGPLGKPWNRRIEPRLKLGRKLIGRATSCMDISDGLSIDLHRLCVASGVGAELTEIPIAPKATLDRALHGGEDYELLFTLPAKARPVPGTTRIGAIVRGKAGKVQFQGRELKPLGYDHFQ